MEEKLVNFFLSFFILIKEKNKKKMLEVGKSRPPMTFLPSLHYHINDITFAMRVPKRDNAEIQAN